MKKLYFCLIPYFVNYDGTEAPSVPECANFLPVDIAGEDGVVYELLFGALCAPVYLFSGGLGFAVSWWISGIPFDFMHCAGNFVMALVLVVPLRRQLARLYSRTAN